MMFSKTARLLSATLLAGTALALAPASAATPLGGLTVAVSPDGATLVAAGDNRVLYVLDPKTLDVKSRHYIGGSILKLGFDKTGATLAAAAEDGTVYLLDGKSFASKGQIKGRHRTAISAAQGLIASADNDHKAKSISLHGIGDGQEKVKFALAKEMPVAAMAISPDGGQLAVLLGGNEDTEEKRANYADIPKELKDLARDEFQQRNDAKTSLVQIYDLKAGKLISEKKTYFSMNGTQGTAAFVSGGVFFNDYSNIGYLATGNGEGQLAKLDGSFLYGVGQSHDGKVLMTGNLRQFAIIEIGETKASDGAPVKIEGKLGNIDRIPGWPEYFKGFDAPANAQVLYGATSAFRVVMLGRDGKVLKTAPVY